MSKILSVPFITLTQEHILNSSLRTVHHYMYFLVNMVLNWMPSHQVFHLCALIWFLIGPTGGPMEEGSIY